MRFDPRVGRGGMRVALGLAVACLAAASGQAAGPDEAAVKYKAFDPGQPRVRIYGSTAVLTGTATVQVDSATIGPAPFQILYTDVYVRKGDGRWQAVAWQSTRPPAPPSPAP